MNIQDSLLAPYVSDPNDDGTYVLNLSHEETMRLWEAVDGQTEELERLLARGDAPSSNEAREKFRIVVKDSGCIPKNIRIV